MSYIYTPTLEYPLSATQILALFPNTSFPRNAALRDAAFAERGYHRVVETDVPSYDPFIDPSLHRLVKQTNPTLVDGTWTIGWDIIPLTEEEIEAYLIAWRQDTAVTPRQLRLALLEVGLLDEIEAMIPYLPRETQVEWEYSVLYERKNPQWDILGQNLSTPLTSVDIDNIFKLALTKV